MFSLQESGSVAFLDNCAQKFLEPLYQQSRVARPYRRGSAYRLDNMKVRALIILIDKRHP